MSHELFYTSAVQGLRPGSQGFCTVSMTRGLPNSLVERLEALSSYRPAFPPHDPRAGSSPVVHAHNRLSISGREVHVLSAIRAAGLDYTHRHNHLAHHVVLNEDEMPAGGPVWLMQQGGFLATEWDGEVKVLPFGRTPPAGDSTPAPCRHWEQILGDAGWAGVLAQAFLDDPDSVAYLVFEPSMDPLPLLAEAVSLLPVSKRWDVTFSTYFTGLLHGTRCAWRCILADSPEAIEAGKKPGVLIFNLLELAREAPDSALAVAARTGVRRAQAPVRPLSPRIVASEMRETPGRSAPPVRSVRNRPDREAEDDPVFELPDIPAQKAIQVPPPPGPVPRIKQPMILQNGHRFTTGLLIGCVLGVPLAGASFVIGQVTAARPQRLAPANTEPPQEIANSSPKRVDQTLYDTIVGLRKTDEPGNNYSDQDCISLVQGLFRAAGLTRISGVFEKRLKERDDLVAASQVLMKNADAAKVDREKERVRLQARADRFNKVIHSLSPILIEIGSFEKNGKDSEASKKDWQKVSTDLGAVADCIVSDGPNKELEAKTSALESNLAEIRNKRRARIVVNDLKPKMDRTSYQIASDSYKRYEEAVKNNEPIDSLKMPKEQIHDAIEKAIRDLKDQLKPLSENLRDAESMLKHLDQLGATKQPMSPLQKK